MPTETSFSTPGSVNVGNPIRAEDYELVRTNEVYLNNNNFKNFTIGTFTRDLSLTGNQNVSVGFSATAVEIYGNISGGLSFSYGFSTGNTHTSVGYGVGGSGTQGASVAIFLSYTITANVSATISIGATAFDIVWGAGAGSATGLFTFKAYGR